MGALCLQFYANLFQTLRCFCHGLKICMWFGYNSGNPTDHSVLPPDSKFFSPQFAFGKIGNLCSVSQALFQFHSIVSVQRQHGKTGAQVNHVVVFFPMYVSGTGTLGNVQMLSLALLHSPNIKVSSAIQYLQLVFLKSQTTNPQLSMYTKSL